MSSQNICNICGANYEYRNGRWVCPACGAYKVEELSNEEVTLLYNAAQKLRLSDFDEAEKAYSDIVEKYPKNPNGYWGRLLSKYGIKYEEDFDGRKIPTCYAASIESVISDKDYIKAIELADADTKAYYQKQAEYIERVRKEWVEKARKEKPYDIFICYKDSDLANGIDRTQDSIAAQDLYIHLTEQGYRVFFSRESLRGKVGEKYEPYIFNALSTAKVMLVYGSKSEYITSTWLKNEWTRYEKRVQVGEKKPNSLIVACDGFSPSELPKALSSMQCFDATKRSFYSDLDAVVKRIIKGEEKPNPVAPPEEKKSKKAPIAIALASVMVAVLLCILIPNIIQGQKTNQIYNSVYDIAVSSDTKLFNKNAKLEVSELYNGDQYDLIVSAVENKIQKQLTNIRILDISCSFEIAEKVTVTMPVDEGINPDNFAVYYVSNTGNIVEECNSKISAGYVDFETTHFSYYVFAEIVVTDDTNNSVNPSDKVTISFDSNGGTGTVSSITVDRNDYFDMPANGFTREGYTFVGWSSTAAGVEWEYPEGAKCKATTSTTYYARWTVDSGNDTTPSLTLKAGVLQVGVCANYEPYEYMEDGKFKGIEIDIIKAIAEELDLTVEFKNMAFEDLCSSLLQEDTDCVIGVTETAARNETLEPSVAMFSDTDLEYIIYTKKGFSELQSALNTTISKLKSSGKITEIIESYKEDEVEQTATIHFNANGGSGSMPSQIVTVGEQSTLNNCSFTYNGYTFSGWGTAASGNVIYTDGASFTADSVSEVTLFAIWVPDSNSLIFNANGGSGSMDSISIETNETITLPSNAFNRAGYTFMGWSDVANGTVKYNNAQSFKMTSSETVTLYAVWSANTNSVVLKANNGTNNETTVNIKTDESKNLPENTFTKAGYTFKGWSSTSGGSVEYADKANYTMGDSSVTLYAIWEANTNSINFNANGGTGTMSAQQAKTDEKVTLKQNSFTREGYTFAGWATTSSGNAVYADQSAYTMGSDSSYTLYAIWIKAAYTITYHMNGGSNNVNNPAGYDVTDATITFADPMRDGYTFLGWYTDAEFQNKITSIPSGSTGNKVVYASWSANTNTINFNSNGGSGSMTAQQAKTDEKVTLKQNSLIRTGYTFKGWSTSSGGTVVYADKASYTMGTGATVTLYAVWETINYSITYDLQGGSISGNKTSYNVTTNTFTLPTPEKEDYIFLGWSGTGIAGVQKTVTVSQGSIGSRTFTANWEYNSYTITLDANGGTISSSTQEVKYGFEYNIPPATRPGYIFLGWFGGVDDSACVLTDSEGNSLSAWNRMEGATFYAHWQANFSQGLSYTRLEGQINDKEVCGYEVSGIGTCQDTTIRIPTEIDGIPVVSIADRAFYGNENIEAVIFPQELMESHSDLYGLFNKYSYGASVTSTSRIYIGEAAFAGCSNLKSVDLTCVGVIYLQAFMNCSKLETVKTDSYLQYIGQQAFSGCGSLGAILIPQSCIQVESYAFSACTNLSIYCEAASVPEEWSSSWNPSNCTVYWGYLPNGYKVDFDYGGATQDNSVTYRFVETGNSYIFPVPTKTGYTFGGWYYGTTQITNATGATLSTWNINSDCTLCAKWNPATNTAYTVKHYHENANDDGYTLQDTEILYGTTDSTVSPSTKTYTGFSAPSKSSVKILPDGSAVLEYHYTRTTHTVSFVTNGGDSIDTMTVKYQQAVTMPNAVRTGFVFGGWFTDVALVNQFTQAYVSSDATLYAWWKEENKPTDFSFTGTSEITIQSYNRAEGKVQIPSYIRGLPVTAIAENAFSNHTTLTQVIIPDTIKTIGKCAFYGCEKLENVVLGSGIRILPTGLFNGCTSLKTVYLGENIKTIYSDAFFWCNTLEKIYTPSLNAWLSLEWLPDNSVPFMQGYDLYINGELLTELKLPEQVTAIKNFAFSRCESLETVLFHNSLESIGTGAFYACVNVEEIIIPKSVVTVGIDAFNSCAITINCEMPSKPEGWNVGWSDGIQGTVNWFYTGDIWDGTTTYSFAGGTGTEQDPYLISTAEQLAYVATAVNQGVDNFNGKYLKQTKDIHLMNREWSPIGTENHQFRGHFDGSGYTIYGLKVTDQTISYSGLFGDTYGATFKNIRVLEADIQTYKGYAGIICGAAHNSDLTTIVFENCHVQGNVKCTLGSYVGGIVGRCNGSINKCSADVTTYSAVPESTTSAYAHVGGIAGSCTTITNCYSTGIMKTASADLYHDNSYVGGIVGSVGTVSNCYSTATVTAITYQSSYCGGIAGSASNISNSFSTGNLQAKAYSSSDAYVGRILGKADETDVVENCYADSTQTCTQSSECYDNEKTTNSLGAPQFTQTLQSENFIYNTLGWSTDIWQINEGGFPTFK